jgi:hypothetical protein
MKLNETSTTLNDAERQLDLVRFNWHATVTQRDAAQAEVERLREKLARERRVADVVEDELTRQVHEARVRAEAAEKAVLNERDGWNEERRARIAAEKARDDLEADLEAALAWIGGAARCKTPDDAARRLRAVLAKHATSEEENST